MYVTFSSTLVIQLYTHVYVYLLRILGVFLWRAIECVCFVKVYTYTVVRTFTAVHVVTTRSGLLRAAK